MAIWAGFSCRMGMFKMAMVRVPCPGLDPTREGAQEHTERLPRAGTTVVRILRQARLLRLRLVQGPLPELLEFGLRDEAVLLQLLELFQFGSQIEGGRGGGFHGDRLGLRVGHG